MAAPGENMRVNADRLWDSLMDMVKIGPGIAGGNNRQTLTDADAEGRRLFQNWCEAAGLSMGVDTMGNMFMTRPGSDPEALPVYVGSHLDTQPTGGKYDGVLGVLAGLEVVRSLNDLGIKTKHPIVVTNWTNEEGARFAPAMLASGVFAGVHTQDYAYGRKDPEGKTFGDELKRIGWIGDEAVGARKMHAYFEYHIEQGPILEAEKKDIGVVTHCQGLWWLEFTLTGREAHTGSTPMDMRVNAGLAAKFGEGTWAKYFSASALVLDAKLIASRNVDRRAVTEEARVLLLKEEGVQVVYTREELEGNTRAGAPHFDQMRKSWNRERSGDLQVALKPYWMFTSSTSATTHGSPHPYDTNVPLLFYGPKWIKPGNYTERVEISGIAPTLALVLRVPPPSTSEGTVLPLVAR